MAARINESRHVNVGPKPIKFVISMAIVYHISIVCILKD